MVTIEVPSENSDTPTEIEFTADEWAIVNAYFDENMNQTRAYLKLHPNCNYDSARVNASGIFAKANIRSEIERRLKGMAMSSDEAIARLGDMARASHKPFIRIDKDGFIYFDFSDPEAQNNLHLIKKIKTKRERRIEGRGESAEEWEGEWVEVELHDASAALDKLLKVHGKYKDEVNVSGEVILKVVREEKKNNDA